MLADENGSVTDTYDYDAFGNLTNSTGSTANNYRYCGEQFDGTTGLYYLRARYMNPNTGTFISMDSYNGSINDPVSLHKYLYANANPVMYSDPSGYMGLFDVVCANAIGNILFSGISSGLINVGLELIIQIRGAEPGQTINFGAVIAKSFLMGFFTGAFFGACGALATTLKSTAIFYALGGSSVLFALMSFGVAYAQGQAGNGDLAIIFFIFGLGGLYGAKSCFDNAAAISGASATAGSTTDTSTGNTQTANTQTNRFGDNDLVYGPSSNGSLRELQQQCGGKLLQDNGSPYENGYSNWKSWSEYNMNEAAQNGYKIHFDLTNMNDVEGVINGTSYPDSVTSYELNYIKNNWEHFKSNVVFYKNGEQVNPPWTEE
jgi:RHS repeat-associated protein